MSRALVDEATELVALLRRHEWLARAWLTTFCTDDLWSHLSAGARDALLALTDEELLQLPVDLPLRSDWPADLSELVLAARRCAPPVASLRTDDSGAHQAAAQRPHPFLITGVAHARNMTPKKQHEVRRLAPVVARVARRSGARTIVDLGSGLGYLSHVLAFHNGLHVVGLEASASNVAAAHQRGWIVREKLVNPKFKVEGPSKAKGRAKAAALPHAANAAAGGGEKAAAAAAAAAAAEAAFAETKATAAAAAARGEPTPLIAHNGGSFCSAPVVLQPDATLGWLEETLAPAIGQIEEQIAGQRAAAGSEAASGEAGEERCGECCGEAEDEADGEADVGDAGGHNFVLVGLHCCGDLTPTLLRLAATAAARSPPTSDCNGEAPRRPRCVAIVSVGCCYHRVSEPLEGESRPHLAVSDQRANADDGAAAEVAAAAPASDAAAAASAAAVTSATAPAIDGARSNLPMSAHCRRLGLSLGEIALHLSLQPVVAWPDQPVAEHVGRWRHHLHRCVLEARLQQLRVPGGDSASGMKLPRDGNVGPLPQCATFADYARRACGRLGIEYDDAEAARMGALWERYAHLERPLRCFVALRGVLARPIERLITLDRLLFMREAGLDGAAIEEVFDPRLSPRSTAIVASWTEPAPGFKKIAAQKCNGREWLV